MDILIILLGLAVGFILLVKGADVMVKSAVQIAVRLNIPQSIIGATFIGFGTSAPELFASTGAALNGNLSLGIGNIIGSNIANSLLVVAVLYLFSDKSYNTKIKLKHKKFYVLEFMKRKKEKRIRNEQIIEKVK